MISNRRSSLVSSVASSRRGSIISNGSGSRRSSYSEAGTISPSVADANYDTAFSSASSSPSDDGPSDVEEGTLQDQIDESLSPDFEDTDKLQILLDECEAAGYRHPSVITLQEKHQRISLRESETSLHPSQVVSTLDLSGRVSSFNSLQSDISTPRFENYDAGLLDPGEISPLRKHVHEPMSWPLTSRRGSVAIDQQAKQSPSSGGLPFSQRRSSIAGTSATGMMGKGRRQSVVEAYRENQGMASASLGIPDADTHHTLYVGNIPNSCAEDDNILLDTFSAYGTVLTTTIRRKPGVRKNWALVTFREHAGLKAALGGAIRVVDISTGQEVPLVTKLAAVNTKFAMATKLHQQKLGGNDARVCQPADTRSNPQLHRQRSFERISQVSLSDRVSSFNSLQSDLSTPRYPDEQFHEESSSGYIFDDEEATVRAPEEADPATCLPTHRGPHRHASAVPRDKVRKVPGFLQRTHYSILNATDTKDMLVLYTGGDLPRDARHRRTSVGGESSQENAVGAGQADAVAAADGELV